MKTPSTVWITNLPLVKYYVKNGQYPLAVRLSEEAQEDRLIYLFDREATAPLFEQWSLSKQIKKGDFGYESKSNQCNYRPSTSNSEYHGGCADDFRTRTL